MIIDRITAIRVIPPKIVTRQVPVARDTAVYVIGSHERQIAEGTTGNVLDVSDEELEVDLYTPLDVILSAQQTQIRSA